jgi:ferric-dicitrate binding protein FerR (iron transport regulator)
VFLKGEAYFEVTRDTARPFCVETAEQNIQVLGTIFNVYAYPDEPMNYTSLMSGKVAVTDKRTGTDRVLEPGQQVVLDVVTGKAAIQEADMQQVLGWRNHDLIVKEETLEVIMAKVARWYDVKIQFAHENLKKMRFTANLHRKKDLQELLKVIATIGDLRLTYQDGIVIIDFK